MAQGWDKEKAWSDRFMPEICGILGGVLFDEAPVVEDETRNTDLIIDKHRVAVRVRSYDYYQKYPTEFTMRSGRKDGKLTELHKTIAGWGDYIFYGFADEKEERLAAWFIGDLRQFRLWHTRYMHKHGKMPGNRFKNSDGSSVFTAYDLNQLPERFVVLRYPK